MINHRDDVIIYYIYIYIIICKRIQRVDCLWCDDAIDAFYNGKQAVFGHRLLAKYLIDNPFSSFLSG